MSSWYKPREATIGGYPAIKNKLTGELSLEGKYGCIWLVNDTTCAAVINSPRVAKKFLPEEKHPTSKGDEVLIKFPISELSTWVNRLKITGNREAMIRMSDWSKFGSDE